MNRHTSVPVTLFTVVLSSFGCRQQSRVPLAIPPVTAKLTIGTKEPIDMEPNFPASPQLVRGDFVLVVTSIADADISAVKVQASKGPFGKGGFEDRKFDGSIIGGAKIYRIQSSLLDPHDLGNNYLLRVVVAPPGSGYEANYYFQHKQPWAFSGVSAPILLRVTGSAAEFSLDNLAPSIAAGIRRNTENSKFPFIALNPLLSVWSVKKDDGSSAFSLALGGVVDISGYLQLGASHQFKDHKTYFIFGLRPEVLYGLTSGAFGTK
jgi:hypothetical protein